MILPRINNSRNAYSTNFLRSRAFQQSKGIGNNPMFDTSEEKKIDEDSKEKNINIFDDKKLANMLGVESGIPISDEKQINWGADGNLQLTNQQIDYLKSKYDITNMSEQDYYDLMSDLTNMNVLSGEEVKKQHVVPIVMGASFASSFEGIAEGEYSNFQGNLLANANSNMQSYEDMLYALNDRNWNFPGQNIQQAKDDLLNQKYVYQKLSSIYNLIKRD